MVVSFARMFFFVGSLDMLSHAQHPTSAAGKGQQLTSPNWTVRRDAFESLLADFHGIFPRQLGSRIAGISRGSI
jgi:hypothetical protein